ncbi:MAG: hypothetical protein AAF517_19020 [Planctomycetota bacterium]
MPKLQQPNVGSLEALLDQAKASRPWFEAKVRAFATASGGVPGSVGLKADKQNQAKPSARAFQKAREKGAQNKNPQGGYRYIKDMIRTSVSYANCGEVIKALRDVQAHFFVVEAKDHFTQPKPGGYVDLNLIVENPQNGHLCELQIHFDNMLHSKHEGGHAAYRLERNATQGARIRDMTDPKERARAMRAVWKGQSAYCQARVDLHHDPKRGEMISAFKALESLARGNAAVYMKKLSVAV